MPSVADPNVEPVRYARENILEALEALGDPNRKSEHRDAAWVIVESVTLAQIAAAIELVELHEEKHHRPSTGWRPARNYEEAMPKQPYEPPARIELDPTELLRSASDHCQSFAVLLGHTARGESLDENRDAIIAAIQRLREILVRLQSVLELTVRPLSGR